MIQNLHTHSIYCDGKHTLEEMLLSAIDKGMLSLGFSSHAPMPFKNKYCIPLEKLNSYIHEINTLKETYASKIEIFLGIESELFAPIKKSDGFDFIISAVHAVFKEDEIPNIKSLQPISIYDKNSRYNGDLYEYIKDYYDLVVKASKAGDILAHFDLVTKHNANNILFDESSKRYLDIANDALLKCIKNNVIFEINTGGIERKYLDRFYPAPYFLELLHENNAKVIITSDAHSKEAIDFYAKEASEILRKYGFINQMILTKNGFQEIKL